MTLDLTSYFLANPHVVSVTVSYKLHKEFIMCDCCGGYTDDECWAEVKDLDTILDCPEPEYERLRELIEDHIIDWLQINYEDAEVYSIRIVSPVNR